jgi:hypothetical protein
MTKAQIVRRSILIMAAALIALAFGAKALDEWRHAIGIAGAIAAAIGFMAFMDVEGQLVYLQVQSSAIADQTSVKTEDEVGRIAEIKVCRTLGEANQYLALGPEWKIHETYPRSIEDEDDDPDFAGDTKTPDKKCPLIFIIARHETPADRERIKSRDQPPRVTKS